MEYPTMGVLMINNEDMARTPPNVTELSAYIDKKLKLRFKLACTAKEISMSKVIEELIEEWLEINEEK